MGSNMDRTTRKSDQAPFPESGEMVASHCQADHPHCEEWRGSETITAGRVVREAGFLVCHISNH